jgi:4-amino-4-deoxychorismate lyase
VDQIVGVLGVGPVDPAAPLLRADDLGVLRGDGCFESVRVRDAATGALDGFDAHLDRLARSAERLALPPPPAQAWRELVDQMLAAGRAPGEAVLRLVLTRGVEDAAAVPDPVGYAVLAAMPAETLRQRREGVRVLALSRGMPAAAHRDAPWLLGGVKTISYAVAMAALRHARAAGADDVIFVSTDGQVLEAPTASVVWASGGTLHTPPPEPLGILPGITVRALFARAAEHGLGAATRTGTVADLHAADGVWLVSSLRVAVPVVSLDGRPLRTDPALTAHVQRAAGLADRGKRVAAPVRRT